MKNKILKWAGIICSLSFALGGTIPLPVPSLILWGEIPFPTEKE